jgi:hypothetical protein
MQLLKRCRREFKKNFPCFLRNHLELVMHVQIILEMTGCCLHLVENFYMHNKPLTNLFKNEKKFKTFTIFFHVLPIRTRLCFIARSFCCCNCLLAITILLNFSELYTSSPYLENPTTLPLWQPLKLSIRTYWVRSMIPSNQSWISSSNDGLCPSRFWHRSMWKSSNVDVVVDTASRKAYCHHPLMFQEQPLSMRISCDLS